jgi:hypothetical protein
MFGYILPEKPELKIKDYELFRAYYCGVCKSIGKRWGQIPRLVLSYDTVFLAVLLSVSIDEDPAISREACILHPFRKKMIIKRNDVVDYVSDMNVILAYYNLLDKIKDEGSIKARAGMAGIGRAFGKLKKKYEKKCDIIEQRLDELAVLEADKCDSIDRACEPFAKILEEVFTYEIFRGNDKIMPVLGWIGYNTGKWIYIMDAFDDIEDNIKRDNYNPLLYQYEYKDGENPDDFKARIRDRVEFVCTYCLDRIAKAYELLEVKRNSGIMENIVYMGMLRKTEQITAILNSNDVKQQEQGV